MDLALKRARKQVQEIKQQIDAGTLPLRRFELSFLSA